MKKIILLVLICFLNLFSQSITKNPIKTTLPILSPIDSLNHKLEKYGTPNIDPFTGAIDEKDSGAVLIKSDRTIQRFSNINLALQSADPGSTIMVYPGTYPDSLTINIENVSIIGISPKSVTLSGPIYISASRGLMENCRITGNQTFLGQTIKALYYVKDCFLENNINVGTAAAPIISNCYFIDCLLGTDAAWTPKTIYVNVSSIGGGAPDIFFHQCFSPVWSNSHNIYLTGGYAQVHVEGSTKIAFNSITIAGGADIIHTPMLFFSDCNLAIISLTVTGFTEISCINSEVTFFSSTTISNNCEFDMFSCKINGATSLDITFNSTLQSRWTHCTGTTNIGHILGSHLEKLHIQYSFFQQTVAPLGLGSDDANTWGVWVDY
ncbi:MAG: hypothetical protein P4L35_08160 [Ignavibacteriaceae bacterium]|nr:hypothetical protein [Ignavibacteriaceae bacterium]